MSELISLPGYRHWIPSHAIKTSETAESKTSGNGSYEPRSLEAGRAVARKAKPITQFYFVMEIQGSGRLVLGNEDEPCGREEKGNC